MTEVLFFKNLKELIAKNSICCTMIFFENSYFVRKATTNCVALMSVPFLSCLRHSRMAEFIAVNLYKNLGFSEIIVLK